MNKEESLSFLQSCIDKVNIATEQDIQFYREMYNKELEQGSLLDRIRAEIEEHAKINQHLNTDRARALCWCLDVIDKYRAERED